MFSSMYFFFAVVMLIFGFGWAKPVPIYARNFKNPKRGMAITALAGPVSNLLLALFATLITSVLGSLTFQSENLVFRIFSENSQNIPLLFPGI